MVLARLGSAAAGAVLGVACVATLSSCTTPQAPPASAPASGLWTGRFALTLTLPPSDQTAQQEKVERVQGRFTLSRSLAGHLALDLFSPFGQTLAQARSDPGAATLTTHDGRQLAAADPDTLIEQALGWRLPVSQLPEWLVSRAQPTGDGGWRVRVEDRFADGRPRTLQADWPTDVRGDARRLRLRVIVDGETG
ncbi:MAG: outer membrane lipoprotein LolB [Burkholderiaceae bacterium]